ncbi:MAG: hypothetical protein L0H93_07870 [Nocardioides sp.]|nr:hypothetical protein [Nocardioides sp.]
MTEPTSDIASRSAWADAIMSLRHTGPGGDHALEQAHPDLVTALRSIPVGEALTIADQAVTRQSPDRWSVGTDTNLSSPWVVVQSIRSALGSPDPSGVILIEETHVADKSRARAVDALIRDLARKGRPRDGDDLP